MSETFTCVKCDRELPIENFQKVKDRKSGHLPACRECMNAYSLEMRKMRWGSNPELAHEKWKRDYQRKKERRAIDPEKRERDKATSRQWYQEHKEQQKEARKRLRDDDPETDLVPVSGDAQWSRITR